MKLLVFGATGGTGRQTVEQALAQGHQVTAFVRQPTALALQHANLAVVQGDGQDKDAVRKVVPGHAVVISALGTRGGAPMLPAITRNILDAMAEHGIRRSLWVSSFGAGDSINQMSWISQTLIVKGFLRQAIEEKNAQEQIIMASGSDWIITRPGGLTDGPATGVYRVLDSASKEKVGRPSISRADVADFMLKHLTGDQYLRAAVGLTY
ncbi:MAG: SDR family oxidoreductase [Anaerolineae bacterium]|jgi:putative NADH-flavin reductase|nr:SDR family oxidoreductase [Anaerolineae bacterium]